MSKVEINQQDCSSRGYVWDAQGAVSLRRELHLLGAFLGGVANFKSQNAVGGLPLEVGPDEVACAVAQGCARVLPPVLLASKSQLVPVPLDQGGDDELHANDAYAHRNKRQRHDVPQAAWLQQYYEYYEALGAYHSSSSTRATSEGHGGVPHSTAQTCQQGSFKQGPSWLANAPWLRDYYQHYEQVGAYGGSIPGKQDQPDGPGTRAAGEAGISDLLPLDAEMCDTGFARDAGAPRQLQSAGAAQHSAQATGTTTTGAGPAQHDEQATAAVAAPVAAQANWKAALQDGALYAVPIKAQGSDYTQRCDAQEPSDTQGSGYPNTEAEHIRHAVFRDLHSKGYAMSAGPKFGADVLAYPGDPCLYHAQFTVRFMEPDQAVVPLALKGAARGSHAARKHLLLATLPDKTQAAGSAEQQNSARQPMYITIAPEAGFGKAS